MSSEQATHRISIKVEQPRKATDKDHFTRAPIFNIDIESPLPAETIQMLANNFFTALVLEAMPKPEAAPKPVYKEHI